MPLLPKTMVAAIMTLVCMPVSGQIEREKELAILLANSETRQSAIEQVVALKNAKIPLLLKWTENPPVGIDRSDLDIALAEVFGRLKTAEAIPFLMRNITIERWPPSPDTWTKTVKVIEDRMPAVSALVQIGPEAARAIMQTYDMSLDFQQRLARIFVVSQVHNVPEAQAFLTTVAGQANLERFWAEEGLKAMFRKR
jgi:hypothetical protein